MDPAQWFYGNELPPFFREAMAFYWDQVYHMQSSGGLSQSKQPMDNNFMVGQSLARIRLELEEQVSRPENFSTKEMAQMEEAIQWLEEMMRYDTLPEEYHPMMDQYFRGLHFAPAGKILWETLPLEIKKGILNYSDFSDSKTLTSSYLQMARALAQAYHRSAPPKGTQMDLYQNSPVENLNHWLGRHMENLAEEAGPDTAIYELHQQFLQALAGESFGEVEKGLKSLDPNFLKVLRRAQKAMEEEIRDFGVPLHPKYRQMLALGLAAGRFFNNFYLGILDFAESEKLIPTEGKDPSAKQLERWRQEAIKRGIIEEGYFKAFRHSLTKNDLLMVCGDLVRLFQEWYQKWGALHPLNAAGKEAFSVGEIEFDYSRRLGQILKGVSHIEHRGSYQILQGMHPEIRNHVEGNLRFLPLEVVENPSQGIARALSLTLAQANRSGHPWVRQFRPVPTSVRPKQLHRWFQLVLPHMETQSENLELWAYLTHDLAELSGRKILEDFLHLDPEMVEAVYEQNPLLRFPPSLSENPIKHLEVLGKGLGHYLGWSFLEIFHLGKKRGWLDPRDYELWLSPRGLSFLYHPPMVPWKNIDRPFVLNTLQIFDWMTRQIKGWGGFGHPLFRGFVTRFYQGDLEGTNLITLKSGAKEIEEYLAQEG